MSKRAIKKSLGIQRLEPRALLAAELNCEHNALIPEDTNGSGDVSAADALVVINQMTRQARNHTSTISGDASTRMLMSDVNADGTTTAQDALFVINRVARARHSGSLISSVPLRDRIERLATDIESGSLPSYFDPATARAILQMLRAGVYPEVEGVSDVDGSIVDENSVQPGDDANVSTDAELDDVEDRVDDSDSPDDVVDPSDGPDGGLDSSDDGDVIDDTPVDEIPVNADDLTEDADCEDLADRLLRLTERLEQRLVSAGITADAIARIIDPITAAIEAGEPLTKDEIRSLLTDAGIDLSLLWPTRPTGDHDLLERIEHLADVLLDDGNVAAAVHTLVDELTAAIDAGTPLTREEIIARIEELGLTLPERPLLGYLDAGLHLVNRLHGIRDAIFASIARSR